MKRGPKSTPILDRLARLAVQGDGDCWLWQASKDADGYGLINYEGRTQRAHRVAYEAFIADIPSGLQIDHLCRNASCINPWHLEPVTALVNTRRAGHGSKTRCKNGHEFTAANTYVNSRGARQCRTCNRISHRKVAA